MPPPITNALHARVDTILIASAAAVAFLIIVGLAASYEIVRRAARRARG